MNTLYYPFIFLLFCLSSCSEPELEWLEVTTEGIPKTITLADNSTVHLNANSYLKYPKEFLQSTRTVELEGEAFFNTKKEEKKFIVTTNGAKITATGTAFNVDTHKTKNATVVNVAEGTVTLQSKSGKGNIELSEGIRGFFNHEIKKLGRIRNSTGNDMYWHTKKIQFNKTYMGRVLEEVNREMHVEITITDAALEKCLFTYSFDNPTMKDIRKAFEEKLGVETFREDDFYYSVIGGGCSK